MLKSNVNHSLKAAIVQHTKYDVESRQRKTSQILLHFSSFLNARVPFETVSFGVTKSKACKNNDSGKQKDTIIVHQAKSKLEWTKLFNNKARAKKVFFGEALLSIAYHNL